MPSITRSGIHNLPTKRGFTLIELLVVIAIIAILAVVVVLVLNPAQLLAQSRDSNRVSDMATLSSAINLYETDQSGAPGYSLGTPNTVYPSVPDPAATSTSGTNCGTMDLPVIPSGYSWHCAASSTYQDTVSTGWIPVNFQAISSGAPFGSLPVDPTNNTSSRLFYTYTTNGSQFELTAPMESLKYQLGGSGDVISNDGSPLATVYAKGTNLTLEPLDYGDPTLVNYWPFNEGTGTVVYDDSGSGNNGVWGGTQAGTSGYYSAGNTQPWAGYFNGSNDYVSSTASLVGSSFTLSFWVEQFSGPGAVAFVSRTNSWSLDISSSTLYVYNPGIYGAQTTGYYPPINTWIMITVTYDGSVNSIYVNGNLVASKSISTIVPTTNSSFMGAANNTGYLPLSGLMNNIRVYNRVLSTAKIDALYKSGK